MAGRSRERVLVALALLFLAAFLWPTLDMPFLGDDTFNAYIDGWIGYEHLSLADALSQFFFETGWGAGRFDPVFPLIVFFNYHVLHSLVALKALVLVAILVNAISLYVLVRAYVPRLALPALVMLPCVLQIRYFHDPIVQFSLHIQIALEFSLISAIALAAYARTARRRFAAVSIASFACAALTYEATYAFVVPLALLVIWGVRRKRERLAMCFAYAAVPLSCSAIVLVLREHVRVAPGSPYAVTFIPSAMARVVGLQLVGALPLSYGLANPNGFLPSFDVMWRASPTMWIAAIVAFSLFLATFWPRRDTPIVGHAAAAVGVAFTAMIAATSMIALSPRWQAELFLGLAYVPVYFEAFAMTVVLAAFAAWFVKSVPRPAGVIAASSVFAIAVGTTYQVNALTLAHYTPWSTVVPRALDAGLLHDAREGDAVYLDDSYPAHARVEGGTWNVKYYFVRAYREAAAAEAFNRPAHARADERLRTCRSRYRFPYGEGCGG